MYIVTFNLTPIVTINNTLEIQNKMSSALQRKEQESQNLLGKLNDQAEKTRQLENELRQMKELAATMEAEKRKMRLEVESATLRGNLEKRAIEENARKEAESKLVMERKIYQMQQQQAEIEAQKRMLEMRAQEEARRREEAEVAAANAAAAQAAWEAANTEKMSEMHPSKRKSDTTGSGKYSIVYIFFYFLTHCFFMQLVKLKRK